MQIEELKGAELFSRVRVRHQVVISWIGMIVFHLQTAQVSPVASVDPKSLAEPKRKSLNTFGFVDGRWVDGEFG